MTDTKKGATYWRATEARWIDNDPGIDTIALTMESDGKEYAVVCAGPKGMKSTDFITAMRAAVAALIAAGGGDISAVGASEDPFDTGDQRAN